MAEGLSPEERYAVNLLYGRARERAPFAFAYLNELSKLKDVTYAIKPRVKSIGKITAKIIRKRTLEKRPDYGVDDITDALGIRFVTLYKRNMIKVLDIVCDLVNERSKFGSSEFSFSGILEAKVYDSDTRGGETTEVARAAKELLENKFQSLALKCEIVPRKSYSSIHLVLLVPPKPGEDAEYGKKAIAAEIQIRTIFEDAWAEINHPLSYESERDAGLSSAGARRADWLKPSLGFLKQFLDTAGGYADLIYTDFRKSVSQMGRLTGLRPYLADMHHYFAVLDQSGIDGRIVADVKTLLERKYSVDELDAKELLADEERREKYHERAQDFGSYFDRLNASGLLTRSGKGTGALVFVLRSQEALSHALAGTEEEMTHAVDIYDVVRTQFPDSIELSFRLGEILTKLGQIDKALSALHRAERLVTARNEGEPRDEDSVIALPESAKKYVAINVYRMMGLVHWRDSMRHREQGELHTALKCLENAYRATVTVVETQHISTESVINNLLFYATEYHDLASRIPELPAAQWALGKDEIRRNLDALEPIVDYRGSRYIYALDTIAYAKAILKSEDAADTAKKGLRILRHSRAGREMDEHAFKRIATRLMNIREGDPPTADPQNVSWS